MYWLALTCVLLYAEHEHFIHIGYNWCFAPIVFSFWLWITAMVLAFVVTFLNEMTKK